ncbi:MAG: 5-bromo-4-chloroindolyl phosphate hydrolysis family protein [Oscillospiraceae bacterium]|nr:5-bromo-4-chloroindolyl phosphate hydrolysis family protein [Oscillospiraceae bacterium]
MGDYYDKNKFTGGGRQPPDYSDPPKRSSGRKGQDNTGWYSWPLIILMFAVGAWPIALILLFFNTFGGEGNQKRRSAAGAKVEKSVEDAVDKVMRTLDQKLAQTSGKTDQAIRKTAAEVERTLQRTADEVERTIRQNTGSTAGPVYPKAEPAPKPKAAAKPKKAAKKKKVKAKPAGVLLRLLGVFCLFAGFCLGADFTSQLLGGYYVEFQEFFASLGFLSSGGVMFFRGRYLNQMSRRSQRYILAIGNVDAMPLSEIAKRVNRTPEKAAKELQKLIDKGYLGEDAYIDYERGYFLRFGATLEEEEPPVFVREEEPVPEPPKEAGEGYSGVLRDIRRANDRIADPELSRKIDRLEQVSALIFKEVEEHPEKRERIHTFFDYYLPTTLKLLDAYAEFEETGVEGEHLREAKERIEQTMDAIVGGFEHQLDQLYSSDAMDVVSDIKVMEAMLSRDTASAAKDFGYDQTSKKKRKDGEDGGQTLQL